MADIMNPNKESSASQFYIVTGSVFSEDQLRMMEKQRYERLKQSIFKELQAENNEELKKLYRLNDKEAMAELRSRMQAQAEEKAQEQVEETKFTPQQKEAYMLLYS